MSDLTNIGAVIQERRTIHEFLQEPLPEPELIHKALKLAQFAPNHHLTEPWHFYLVGSETKQAICDLNYDIVKTKKDLATAEKKLKRWQEIPGWIIVTCDKTDDALRIQEDYAAVACAIQNFSLYLWSHEIGCKWSTGEVIRDPRFYEIAWLEPEQEYVVGLIWYGYPKEIPQTTRASLDSCLVTLP